MEQPSIQLPDLTTLDPQEREKLPDDVVYFMAVQRLTQVLQEIRESPIGLYRHVFTTKEGGPVFIKDFHEEWAYHCQQDYPVIIEASRGLTKTSFVLAFILWKIGTNPNVRIKLLTETEQNAKKRILALHDLIDKSALLQAAFPELVRSKDKRAENSSLAITLVRDVTHTEPTVEGRGVLSAGTGGRCDVLILDDVVGESNAVKNPSLKPKVLSKLQSDWFGTMVDDAKAISICTPWADDDANAWLKKKAKWHYVRYAHGLPNDPYHSIFEEIWPREKLISRRRWVGLLHYERQYLCRTSAKGVSAITAEDLKPYYAIPGPTAPRDNPFVLTEEKLDSALVIISNDIATGANLQKGKLDYSAPSIGLVVDTHDYPAHPPFQVFVADAYQVNLPLTLQPYLAHSQAYEWGANVLLYEANGMQQVHPWIVKYQQQSASFDAPIIPIKLSNVPKGQRLVSISPMLNRPEGDPPIVLFHPSVIDPEPKPDQIVIADGSKHEILRDFRDQVLSFPAKHDDIMDSVVQLLGWVWFIVQAHGGVFPPVEALGLENYAISRYAASSQFHNPYANDDPDERDAPAWLETLRDPMAIWSGGASR